MVNTIKFQLNNKSQIPAVGLGTSRVPPEQLSQTIQDAIDIGYRHFDTAYFYNTEQFIGDGISAKMSEGIKREELFITTKLWNTFHHPDDVEIGLKKSLDNLKLEYVDLYLMHYPIAFKRGDAEFNKYRYNSDDFVNIDYVETWKAMEKLVQKGLTKSIGLSNFDEHQLERVLKVSEISPAVLQTQRNPYMVSNELIKFCQENGIQVVAHSPLNSPNTYSTRNLPNLLLEPILIEIAKKHSKSSAQIALKWQVQKGVGVIPKSVHQERLKENLNLFDFELSEEDIEAINGLNKNYSYGYVPGATEYLLKCETI